EARAVLESCEGPREVALANRLGGHGVHGAAQLVVVDAGEQHGDVIVDVDPRHPLAARPQWTGGAESGHLDEPGQHASVASEDDAGADRDDTSLVRSTLGDFLPADAGRREEVVTGR